MRSSENHTPLKTSGRPRGGSNTRPGSSTLFGQAVALCGLTLPETATYLGVSLGSVRAYSLGTRHTPPTIMDRMALLYEQVSFRTPPKVTLPDPAQQRRQAIQDLRTRSWKRKAEIDDDDDEGGD